MVLPPPCDKMKIKVAFEKWTFLSSFYVYVVKKSFLFFFLGSNYKYSTPFAYFQK